jgi:cell division protein FtsI/penicillin-binding protein 2
MRTGKWHRFRGAFLLCVLLAGFAAVGARLVWLQLLTRDELVKRAEKQHTMNIPIPARRGAFFDSCGKLLCTSAPVKSVFVDPLAVAWEDVPGLAKGLARDLRLDEAVLYTDIISNYDKSFVWVKRRVTDEEAALIQRRQFPGVVLATEYRRNFPMGALAPHLLGWTNVDGAGVEGLELALNDQLRGINGSERLACDSRRRSMLTNDSIVKPAQHGNNVQLTIDSNIQRIVSRELDKAVQDWNPSSATAIVMEVKTGRILAIDNRPTYDPAEPGAAKPEERLNRAVASCYEPGSVFKPFTMAGCIESGLGRPEDRIFCENGLFRINGRRLRDHSPYGWLTYTEVIAKSSNIGMAKIGLTMGAARIYRTITAFGFGRVTGLGLPGEIPGIVHGLPSWSYYTVTSVPMGQEISATPLQLITAFNAIANDGVLVKPQIVQSITNPDGEVLYRLRGPEVVRRVISSSTARTLINPMMRSVVTMGTAKAINRIGEYPKFGKTGTAQKAGVGGFSHSLFVASFMCGAPADDPVLSVIVLIDEPHKGSSYYGATVAAPAAGRIIEEALKYLNVPVGTVAQGQNL